MGAPIKGYTLYFSLTADLADPVAVASTTATQQTLNTASQKNGLLYMWVKAENEKGFSLSSVVSKIYDADPPSAVTALKYSVS